MSSKVWLWFLAPRPFFLPFPINCNLHLSQHNYFKLRWNSIIYIYCWCSFFFSILQVIAGVKILHCCRSFSLMFLENRRPFSSPPYSELSREWWPTSKRVVGPRGHSWDPNWVKWGTPRPPPISLVTSPEGFMLCRAIPGFFTGFPSPRTWWSPLFWGPRLTSLQLVERQGSSAAPLLSDWGC